MAAFDHTKKVSKKKKADLRHRMAFTETIDTVRLAILPKKLPTVMILSGIGWLAIKDLNDAWRAFHVSIVNQTHGSHVIAEKSKHMVTNTEPDLVVVVVVVVVAVLDLLKNI